MKNEKSQITIYALLGLIILVGFGLVLYLKNSQIKSSEIEKSSESLFDTASIKLYMVRRIEKI